MNRFSLLLFALLGCSAFPTLSRAQSDGTAPTTQGTTSEADTLSDIVQLTRGFDRAGEAYFSPDGKRIVYRGDRQHNDLLQMFVGDLAFDAHGNITGLAAEHQIAHDTNVNWGPYWYPDNQHIIYSNSRHGHTNFELYVMRDDGSYDIRITYTDGADILPVFSIDGKYLMWTSKRTADHTTQIFIAHFQPPKGW